MPWCISSSSRCDARASPFISRLPLYAVWPSPPSSRLPPPPGGSKKVLAESLSYPPTEALRSTITSASRGDFPRPRHMVGVAAVWAAYDLGGKTAALGAGQRHGGVDPGPGLLLCCALRHSLSGGFKPQIDQTHRLFQQFELRRGFDHPAARQEKPGVRKLVSPAATAQGAVQGRGDGIQIGGRPFPAVGGGENRTRPGSAPRPRRCRKRSHSPAGARTPGPRARQEQPPGPVRGQQTGGPADLPDGAGRGVKAGKVVHIFGVKG